MEQWENPESLWEELGKIRKKVEEFAYRKGSRDPEEDAANAIFLTYQKFSTGGRPETSLLAYCCGIVRNLLCQRWKKEKDDKIGPLPEEGFPEGDEDEMLTHLNLIKCLKTLDVTEFQLLLLMMDPRSKEKTKEREALAGKLGISSNGLDQRYHRLRISLQECLNGKRKENQKKN